MKHRYNAGDTVRVTVEHYPEVPANTLALVLNVASDGGLVVRVAGQSDAFHFNARDVRIQTRGAARGAV